MRALASSCLRLFTASMALRNMLDGDGQDQFDAGGWCFPKPIPPVQRNGDWIVLDPMMPTNTNQAFEANLRIYPGEKYPRKKKDWQSVQGGSILTICKLHPSQRPPMVRPEDDNELGQQDVDAFIKNLVENGQPVVKAEGLGKNSLTAKGGAASMLGAPEGVEANNFDGQRGFDASAFGM